MRNDINSDDIDDRSGYDLVRFPMLHCLQDYSPLLWSTNSDSECRRKIEKDSKYPISAISRTFVLAMSSPSSFPDSKLFL